MKIALLTIWHSVNYGAELQTYASVRTLQEMGHEVKVIDFRLGETFRRCSVKGLVSDILHSCAPVKIKFHHFWANHIPSTRHFISLEELKSDPPQADLYIVGSDQVWNPQITKARASAYFLDFVPAGAVMASYASSIGTDKWLGDAELTTIAQQQLVRFKGISCREQQGCKILKDTFGVDAELVLDPSLLHKSYPELTGRIRPNQTLAYYQLAESTALMQFAVNKAQDMGLEFVDVNHHSQLAPTYTWNRRSVGQWIKAIAEAQFVITHSFHGLVLSLLYHRPFVIIYDSGNKASRLVSLLQIVGLESRLFFSIDDASRSDVWKENINWQSVDNKIALHRDRSINYLDRITTE